MQGSLVQTLLLLDDVLAQSEPLSNFHQPVVPVEPGSIRQSDVLVPLILFLYIGASDSNYGLRLRSLEVELSCLFLCQSAQSMMVYDS